jgi:MFS family permease
MTANAGRELARPAGRLPWLGHPAAARRAVVAGAFISLWVTPLAVIGQTTGLLIGPVTQEFGWSHALFVMGPSVAGAICGLLFPLVGLLGDRIGLRPVLLTGIFLYGLSLMAMALMTGSVPVYFGLSTMAAIAGLTQTSVLYAKAISGWFDARRGLMLGIAVSGGGVGSILMPLLAGVLIERTGWRGAFLGLGFAVIAIAAPAVLLLVQEAPRPGGRGLGLEGRARPDPGPRQAAVPGLTLAEAARTATFWRLLLLFALSNAALWSLVTNLAPALMTEGLGWHAATAAVSALGASQVISRPASGYLLDRTRRGRPVAVWYLLATGGALLLEVARSTGSGIAVALLVGAAWGAENEVAAYLTSRYFGMRAYGLILGTFFAAFSFGGMPLAFLVAHLFDVYRNYHLATALMALCLAASCALSWSLGSYAFSKDGSLTSDATPSS